jgi:hypothetical protein
MSRTDDTRDRRKLLLRATDKGEELLAKLRERRRGYMSEILASMSADELTTIAQGLAFLVKAMEHDEAENKDVVTIGLSATIPAAMYAGLTQNGISSALATKLAHAPPMGYLFAALLGYNPMGTSLGPQVLSSLPAATAAQLTSRSYFPQLISAPFHSGLTMVLLFSLISCLIAAAASWVRGGKYVYQEEPKF